MTADADNSGTESSPVTALLARIGRGDSQAREDLLPLVYGELRRLARIAFHRERAGHTLQPTALVHEAFLRLFNGREPAFADRAHFLGVAACVMRQVLVDHARGHGAQKRGAEVTVQFSEHMAPAHLTADMLELDEALGRLGEEDPRLVTLIEMRFFAGMTAEETAEARRESVHAIRRDLRYAQARLRRFMATNPI